MKLSKNWAVAASIILLLTSFLLTGFLAKAGLFDGFNLKFTQAIQQWNNKIIINFMQFVSVLEFLAPLILLILIIFFHLKKNYAEILFLLLSTGYLIPKVLKDIYQLGCPAEPLVHKWSVFHLPYIGPLELLKTDFCFPSGHVFSYVAFAGFLFYLSQRFVRNPRLKKIVSVLLLSIIVLIGPSRIYLGAHWAGDVVGGYFLGFSYLLAIILIYEKRRAIIDKFKSQNPSKKYQVSSTNYQ